jgi:hypothetical protein
MPHVHGDHPVIIEVFVHNLPDLDLLIVEEFRVEVEQDEDYRRLKRQGETSLIGFGVCIRLIVDVIIFDCSNN